MGIFDFFKRNKFDDAALSEQQSQHSVSWPERFADFHDWNHDKKSEVGFEFISDLKKHLDSAQIKRIPREAELDPYQVPADRIDLRGRHLGVPIRVTFEVYRGLIQVVAKHNNTNSGRISFAWDPRKKPIQSSNDDWEDEEIRLFVAKGVFVEGFKETVRKKLNAFTALPADFGADILANIRRYKFSEFDISSDEISVECTDNVRDMYDPLSSVWEVVDWVAKSSLLFSAETPSSPQSEMEAPSVAQLQLVRCSYCSATFNIANNSHCPNCGAPYDQ